MREKRKIIFCDKYLQLHICQLINTLFSEKHKNIFTSLYHMHAEQLYIVESRRISLEKKYTVERPKESERE